MQSTSRTQSAGVLFTYSRVEFLLISPSRTSARWKLRSMILLLLGILLLIFFLILVFILLLICQSATTKEVGSSPSIED
jgi:hypothetical protein